MSRGLGKTQRAVLNVLQNEYNAGAWRRVCDLAMAIYQPDKFIWEGKFDLSDTPGDVRAYTRGEYVSTARAVQGLVKIGLLEAKVHKETLKQGQGGATAWKSVRLCKC